MAEHTEVWKATFEYWWRGWRISKDKGWYSIVLEPDTRRVRVPLKFKRLGEAKKYCETLDTLIDRTSLPAEYQWLDQMICAHAASQMSLDYSRLSIAGDLQELAEELKRR